MPNEKLYVPGYTDRKTIDEENGTVDAMVSVKELDRDREVVLPEAFRGAGLRDFLKNPVTFLFHRSWGFPCGRATKVEIQDKGIRGTTQFALEIPGAVGDEIRAAWEMVKGGFLNALSIGFWADAWESDPEAMAKLLPELKREVLAAVRRVLTRGRLAEWSFVGIGSAPSALVERMVKGEIPDEVLLEQAPPEVKELFAFARKFEWRKDQALREWCGDHELDVEEFEPSTTTIVDLGAGLELHSSVLLTRESIEQLKASWDEASRSPEKFVIQPPSSASPYFVERDGAQWLECPLDDDPMGEKLSVPLDGDDPEALSVSESQREKLQAVAEQLTRGATLLADLLDVTAPEGEMTDEKAAAECAAALEEIGILTEVAGATPSDQSGGPDGTSR